MTIVRAKASKYRRRKRQPQPALVAGIVNATKPSKHRVEIAGLDDEEDGARIAAVVRRIMQGRPSE